MQDGEWTPSFMWKENGKRKQDSDLKPMCQAERRVERRMQTVTGNQCIEQKEESGEKKARQ